jgi:hypothetical protein
MRNKHSCKNCPASRCSQVDAARVEMSEEVVDMFTLMDRMTIQPPTPVSHPKEKKNG